MSPSFKKLYPYLLIAGIAFAAYAQILWFDFVHLDEDTLIIGNQNFISDIGNITEVFKHDVNYPSGFSAYYRPVLTLTFMTDALMGGLNPLSYHFSNIVFHMIASLLLYVLLLKFNRGNTASLFLSLIFAVHPVLNQALAWIPGRNDSLLAIFVFSSFIFFINLMAKENLRNLFVHSAFFALAMFTKETAASLPLACLAYYVLLSQNKLSLKFKYYLAEIWVGVFGAWFFLRNAVLKIEDLAASSIVQMAISHSSAILIYIGKIIFPFKLSVLPTLADSSVLYGLISLFAILALVLISKKSYRPVLLVRQSLGVGGSNIEGLALFGVLWFLLFIAPVLVSYDHESRVVFFEHRIYVPMAGFLIILLSVNWEKIISASSKIIRILMAGIIAALFAVTTVHLRDFKDGLSFWQSAVKNSPSLSRSHKGLGTVYFNENNFELAETAYMKALELNPEEKVVHNNLGVVYVNKKMFDEAEGEFKKETELNPLYEPAYYNLGRLYAQEKNFSEAEKYWLKALELKPDYIQVHQDLAVYYFQKADYKASLNHINEIIKYGALLHPELAKVKALFDAQAQ